MPIKGLSQRAAILGRIKIGGRKKINTRNGERVIPTKFDHFQITTNEMGELGYVVDESLTRRLKEDQFRMLKDEATEKIYEKREVDEEIRSVLVKTIQHIPDDVLREKAQKLTRILVTLPSDEPEENLVTSLSVYDRLGCRCRGDNETAEWIDPNTGVVTKVSCPCNMLKIRLNNFDEVDQRPPHQLAQRGMTPNEQHGFMCKAHGILRVRIEQARTIGGVYLFQTTSMNSIFQLLDSMNSIRAITGGTLAGCPLTLIVEPKRLRPKPNKPAHTGYVVNLIFKANEDEFLRYVIEKKALIQQLRGQLASEDIKQLPVPGHEPRIEQIAIAEEYYAGQVSEEEAAEAVTDAQYEKVPPRGSSQKPPERDTPAGAPGARQEAQKAQRTQETPETPKTQEKAQETQGTQRTQENPEKAQKAQETQEAPDAPERDATATEAPGAPEKAQETQEAAETVETPDSPPAAQESPPVDEEPQSDPTPVEGSPPQGDQQEASQDGKADSTDNRFPAVNQEQPEGADTSPASKALRKDFFNQAKQKGMETEDIRAWVEELWHIQSSAALKTWQVEAMIQSLA